MAVVFEETNPHWGDMRPWTSLRSWWVSWRKDGPAGRNPLPSPVDWGVFFFLARGRGACHLLTDDHTVAAGGDVGALLLVLGVGGGARVVVVAAGATAVEADAVAGAGDAVALADARGAVGAGGAVAREIRGGAGRVGAVRERGAGGRDGGAAAEVIDDVLSILVLVVDAGGGEALAQLILVEVDDVAGGTGVDGLGSLDLGDREGAALGDLGGAAGAARRLVRLAGVAGRALGGRGRRLGGLGRLGGIEDVEGAASGGLNGGLLAGVVRDVVSIDDVVVPVALASLDDGGLEAEGALPRAGLGRGLVLGERELTGVVVPGTKKVDGLDARRNTETKRKGGRHVD
jgi:hypothetical protein